MKKFVIIVLSSALLILLNACDKEEQIPSYIHISDFDLVTENKTEGSDSHDITEAWIFARGNLLGVFDIPSDIPVLENGLVEIVVFPAIKLNGSNSTSQIYPFYESVEIEIDLNPLKVDSISPVTNYRQDADIILNEDFESLHLFTDDVDGNPNTRVENTNIEVFEGNSSGQIILDEENNFIETGYNRSFQNITVDGPIVYIELNYKSNIPFRLGFRGFTAGLENKLYNAVVFPSNNWNKIYFDFTDVIASSNEDIYQFGIFVLLTETNDGSDQGRIYLDNIKVIRQGR